MISAADRRRARRWGVALLMMSGLRCACAQEAGSDAVVLMYHHVDTQTPPSTSVTPDVFARHLEVLARGGFTVWPLSRIVETLATGKALPPNTVAITFDDGYASISSNALPMLIARQWPFTVFVSTDAIDKAYRGYMNWNELRALVEHGGEIANHTRSHAHLIRRLPGEDASAWESRARGEIVDAQRRIDVEIGTSVRLFAYPYGEFDADLERIVEDLGYHGFGQHSGALAAHSNLYSAPRFPLATGFDDIEEFARRARSRALRVSAPRTNASVLAPNINRPALEFEVQSGGYDLERLACYAGGQGRMDVMRLDDNRFVAAPRQALTAGRTKYNCTAPSRSEPGVYYWYSYLWMKKRDDNIWYDE